MKLIREVYENAKIEILEGKEGKQKSYFIEGVFLQSEVQNRNGRIYPKQVLDREVHRYLHEAVANNRALGELNHPDSPTINLDRVSHMITSINESGNDYIGKAKIMDTPTGKIVKAFIDEGVQLGVSSRGMGSLRPITSTLQEVQDDYYLSTVDIVADPSAPDAFVRGIFENKEWVWDNGILVEKEISEMKKQLDKPKKKINEDLALQLFKKFMDKLK